ncbi:PilZ domain-containing protein [Desulfonatronovibrio magnus]|uniref:PilZ domain-containing protein n=1 Tax=Desulfonatronovibrio magnus TaxID=698827 RepID=UPI0005EB9940|nr:PilZ domain-containing protein [Desulfonatronovibrio magnus]
MSNSLKKEVYIDEKILDRLESVAKRSELRLSTLLDQILRTYIEDNEVNSPITDEKRKFKRKNVVIPAMVYEKSQEANVGRYYSTTVLDISIGGTRLAFPIDRDGKIEFIRSNSDFEVILYLTDTEVLSRFKCNLKHVEKNDYTIKVGGAFTQCDEFSNDQLNQYFMQ